MSRLLRGASLTLAARIGSLALGIASSIIVARALGPAGKGEYALIVLIPALLQLAGGLGLDQAVTYLIAPMRDRARTIAFTLTSVGLALGGGLILIYGALSRLPAYGQYLAGAGVEPGAVWILILLMPAALAARILTAAILALERYRDFNLSGLITPAVTLAILVLLLAAVGLDVRGAVLASAGGTAAGLLGAALLFLRAEPGGPARFESQVLRDAFGFGWRAHLADLAWFLHYRADMFLVAYLAGPAALGFYSIAVGLAERLYMAPSAVGTVLFPRIASDREPDGSVTARACRHTLWITVILGVGLAVLARPVVRLLYGGAFLPSVGPLWVLLPGVASLAVGRVVSADLNGRGLPGVVARANSALAAVNIGLNLWWIPLWGAAGAAAATSLSYTAAAALLALRYRHASGTSWRDLLLVRRGDLARLRTALADVARAGPGPEPEIVPPEPGP